ncbi:MAG: nucleoside monophosphate kinase [Verrucomicrobiota bacterium]
MAFDELHRYRTFLILGAPGSGKGTIGRTLGALPRFFYMACGDVFRSLDTRTELGQKFVEYSSRGQLVPDDVTVKFWRAHLNARSDSHEFKPDIDFLVLDGIPRNVSQAALMEDHIDVLHVLHLSCPNRQELIKRIRKRALKENRMDDARDDVIQERIKTYEAETKPLLEFYGPGRVTDIDALRTPAEVMLDVLQAIIGLPAWKQQSVSVAA